MQPHIKKYLIAGEGEQLDFKQSVSSASKIAKSMVSFANTKGGVLLVGIRDNKSVSGVRSEEEKYMLDLAANFFCKPPLEIELREWIIEGKTVLECKIKEGKEKPYYCKGEDGKWWVYVRSNDQCLLASKTMMDFMKKQRQESSTQLELGKLETQILSLVSNANKITLKEICKKCNISKWRASKILVNLMSLGVVRNFTHEKTEYFTS